MSFRSISKKLLINKWKIAFAFVLFLSLSSVSFAQITPSPSLPEVENGENPPPIGGGGNGGNLPVLNGIVKGYAWMGTGIQSSNASEGGGGWLRFNCFPDLCDSERWGVQVEMDENSPRYGYLSGQAWSNNYGWLDFSEDNVSRCWQANPAETANSTARVLFSDGSVKPVIVGWGKFVAGDDFSNDGWDGCVSFSGVEYAVFVNMQTGALEGWAWGSDVVGWISFQNPECPFCDVAIDVEEQEVIGCMDPVAINYNPLATQPGRCAYGPVVRGCMDPVAINYNPLATIDDGSCQYNPRRVTLNLQATPDTLVASSGNYNVGLTWTSNNPSQLSSCVGGPLTGTAVFDLGNQTNWDGARNSPNVVTPFDVDLAPYAATATPGQNIVFRLTCNVASGGTVSATDQVNIIAPTTPPVEPPLISLAITDPNTDNNTSTEIISPWNSVTASGGANPVTLRWQALNVVPGSCLASSERFVGATSYGANPAWNGQTLSLDVLGYGNQNLTNINTPENIRNTKFQISCIPLNAPATRISAQVCMGVEGSPFPQSQCSAGNSINRPPSYKEI